MNAFRRLGFCAAVSLLAACSYEIKPAPPTQLPRADGAPLALHVAVAIEETTIAGQPANGLTAPDGARLPDVGSILVQTLDQANLFARASSARTADAVVSAKVAMTYKNSLAWFIPMFLPLCDPALIGCWFTYDDACAVDLDAAVLDSGRTEIKRYSENGKAVASHTAGTNFSMSQQIQAECLESAARHAVAQLVQDLIKDRPVFAKTAPVAPPPEAAPAPAPTAGEAAPWWKN